MFSRLLVGNSVFHWVSSVKSCCDTAFCQLLPVSVSLQNLTVLNMPSAFYFTIFLSCIDYCLGHIHKVNLAVS